MSNSPLSKKIAIVVVVLVIIIILLFIMNKSGSSSQAAVSAAPTQTASSVQQTTTPPPAPVDPSVAQVKASGDSDASLNQDMANLDQQMSAYNSDTQSASASGNTTTK